MSGIKILKSTLDPIIGQPADKETAKKICEEMTSYENILGVHDLILHKYGEENIYGTAHVEMPSDMTLNDVHEIIDCLERDIKAKYSINISIHVDPVESADSYYDEIKNIVADTLKRVDESLSFHDLRIVKSPLQTNLVFDVTVTKDSNFTENELKKKIDDELQKVDKSYCSIITVERNFID